MCATAWRIDEVDVRGCFAEVNSMVKLLAKTGVAVTAAVAPEVPPLIMSDRQRLVQVLLNLMTNAMKYTDAGSVTLSATTTFTAAATAAYLVIRCEDSGPGILPQHQKGLFTTRFSTLPGSRAGTGLGLAVSKILVEKLGG
jgi:signal transduction histidine kinase